MATIALSFNQGFPVVTAKISIDNTLLPVSIEFLIDTGAEVTFVCDKDEKKLGLDKQQGRFSDPVTARTPMGWMPARKLICNASAIVFRDLDGKEISRDIPFFRFGMDWPKKWLGNPEFADPAQLESSAAVWKKSGLGLTHSLLGRDCLNQFLFLWPNHHHAKIGGFQRDEMGFLLNTNTTDPVTLGSEIADALKSLGEYHKGARKLTDEAIRQLEDPFANTPDARQRSPRTPK